MKITPKATIEMILVATWLLTGISTIYGCSKEESHFYTLSYASVQDCLKDLRFTESICRQEWHKAQLIHERSTPTYQSPEDCQKNIKANQCEKVTISGRSVYRPLMKGFIFDAVVDKATSGNIQVVLTQPIYGSSSGGYSSVHDTTVKSLDSSLVKPGLVSNASLTKSKTLTLSQAKPIPTSTPKISIGTNLSGLSYWSTELPFKDSFRTSGSWWTQANYIGNTHEEIQLKLDSNGWVKSLDLGNPSHKYKSVGTLLLRETGGNYKGGKYVVLYDGQGTIQYHFDAKQDLTASRPGRDVINVTPSGGGIYLEITAINPNNYIRNIRVVPLSQENNYQIDMFNPDFIKKIKPFRTLRFMDWMNTNNSKQQNWSDRHTLNSARWSGEGGAPVEVMVALANKINSNPWFTMPAQATDDYVRHFAQYVKAHLNPGLKVYVEYSNEVWNGSFKQSSWVQQQAKQAWPSSTDGDYTKLINWYSMRTTQVLGIWDQVFSGQTDRVIGVMGAQSANTWAAKQALSYAWSKSGKTSANYGIKAVAIAPYFGGYLGSPKNQVQVQSWTTDPDGGLNKLFTELQKGGVLQGGPTGGGLQETYNQIAAYVKLAKQNHLQLLAYEGGQGLVGYGGVENNQAITNLFEKANRDPRMGNIYKQDITKWAQLGGGLFNNFSDIGRYNKWGSWCVLENLNQTSSPKYDALMQLIQQSNK